MAAKPKRIPLFAMLFADLMMGATGVIIVLLVFLQVVSEKGFGSEVDSSAIRLPPGLMEVDAMPMVRLRIAECDNTHADNISITGYKGNDNVVYKGLVENCHIIIVHYPTGLHNNKLQIISNKGQKLSTETHITVTVGGYAEFLSINGEKPPGHTLAIVAISAELIDEQ